MLKVLGAAAAGLVISAGAASAQSAPIWTGVYLGAHGGGGWGDIDEDSDDIDLRGGLGGLHGGYNWQSGAFLVGAEGEVSFGSLSGDQSQTVRENIFGTPFTIRASIDAKVTTLASLKGRIGYVAGPVLVYATGGVAWTWLDIEGRATATGGGLSFSQSVSGKDTLVGWTAGGGIEYKFMQNLSGRVDVQHDRFDDTFDFAGSQINDVEVDLTVVRGGLTFHFN